MEDFVLYLIFGAIALLQLAAKAWRERRERREPQQTLEPSDRESEQGSEDDAWRNPPAEPEIEAAPVRAPSPALAPERDEERPRRKPRAPQARKPELARPAVQHRIALNDRAELRRAFELMAILGPPRSRAPDDI